MFRKHGRGRLFRNVVGTFWKALPQNSLKGINRGYLNRAESYGDNEYPCCQHQHSKDEYSLGAEVLCIFRRNLAIVKVHRTYLFSSEILEKALFWNSLFMVL